MKWPLAILLFMLCLPTALTADLKLRSLFIIWNVGQGQMTTLKQEESCDHFDFGGERNVTRQVASLCGHRQQRLHLSHWDWDHMSEIESLRHKTPNLCLWNWPLHKGSPRKESLLRTIPMCQLQTGKQPPYIVIFPGWSSASATSNETSEVVRTSTDFFQILIPGDSPVSMERHWGQPGPLSHVQGLILGHHGSRTSTSSMLLTNLKHLKWAVASAREKRYGHPHTEVLKRLQKYKTPVLRTEDWGTIIFIL